MGFSMPAEWEPHQATWIAWPHNLRDWPGRFGPVPWVFADIVKKLAEGEIVRLLVNDAAHQARARRHLERQGANLDRVDFRRIPTDRVWTRDSGPIVVRKGGPGGGRAVAGFRFDAWSKYPDWKRDARIPERAARAIGLSVVPIRRDGRVSGVAHVDAIATTKPQVSKAGEARRAADTSGNIAEAET
jgi:agmatine deiminase